MSFLKKLFGGGGGGKDQAPAATAEHKGFTITATPYKEGGQFQTCGTISKEIGGGGQEDKFIRAAPFADFDEAEEFSLNKGRQIVDDMGERIFG